MRMRNILFLPLMMAILAGCGGGGGGGGAATESAAVQATGPVAGNGSGAGGADPSPAAPPSSENGAAAQPADQPSGISKTINLAWNPSLGADGQPDPQVSGYRLYYGNQSGQYAKVITLGKVTTTDLSGLDKGKYYFALTAFNAEGGESPYSEEVGADI